MTRKPERWAEIEGFPDYAVSTHGRVKNVHRNREIQPFVDSYGHVRVTLRREKRSKVMNVGKLVASTFFTRVSYEDKVRYLDGDRENNYVENLTVPEFTSRPREISHPKTPQVRKLRVIELDEVYDSVAHFCKLYNMRPQHVHAVLNGTRPHHQGYTFEYIYIQDKK